MDAWLFGNELWCANESPEDTKCLLQDGSIPNLGREKREVGETLLLLHL